MPSLILSYSNQELHTYQIEKDQLLKIGRGDQNDIILDEKAVSSLHAEIEFEAGEYYITDIGSKNGTFIDGELVISRKLKNENVISIGNYSLRFQNKDSQDQDEAPDTISQATMMLDTSIHRSKLAKSLAEIGGDREKNKTRAELTFLDDSEDPLTIDKPVIKIGKENDCDIKIKGLFLGKTGAEIYQREETFYIKPSEAKSRVKLNYKKIKAETVLKDFDVIEVGSTKIQFHIRVL